MFYDIVNIAPANFEYKKTDNTPLPFDAKASGRSGAPSVNTNVSQSDSGVNPKNQLSLRTNEVSDINRQILSEALMTAAQTEREKERLTEYQGIISQIGENEKKLTEVTNQLHELNKVTGKKDMVAIRDLKDQKIALENKITNDDRKLLQLQATKPLQNILSRSEAEFNRIAKEQRANAVRAQREADAVRYGNKIADIQQKNAERLAAVRADRDKKIQAQKDHDREVAENKADRHNRTGLRNDIKKIMAGMDKMMNHPVEGKYVPKALRGAVAEILTSIDRSSGREGAAADRLEILNTQYRNLAQAQDNSRYLFDDTVAEMLQTVAAYGVPLREMDVQQLQNVKDALKALNHVIKQSVKQETFKIDGISRDMNVFEFARKLITETRSIPSSQKGMVYKAFLTQLRPETVMKWFGGYSKNSAWNAVYNAFDNAQKQVMNIQKDLSSGFEDIARAKEAVTLFDTKNMVDVGLKDDAGNTVYITRGMMLSLYMHLLNEENARHVMDGGLTIPNMKQYYRGNTDAAFGTDQIRVFGISQGIAALYDRAREINQKIEIAQSAGGDTSEYMSQLTEIEMQIDDMQERGNVYIDNLLSDIEGKLTAYEKKVIAATQELYRKSQGYLNDATNRMYGFDKANVENYFPIVTDKAFLGTQFDSISANFNLENAGFMKERQHGANPILLTDIMDTNTRQIRRTSQYAGFTPTLKDFNKVFGKAESGYADSVQKALEMKFGKEGNLYIEHLMADINGGNMAYKEISGLDKILSKVRGGMAQATLSINPRVALSQTASLPTAAAELGYKAVAYSMSKTFTKADNDLIAKYSPLLWYRAQSGSDTELGDMKTAQGRMRNSKAYNYAMGWISAMDKWTVQRLWFGSEYWVEHNTNLKKGTDEFYKAVAEKFDVTVERTQPNYSTLQRSDILRSKNELVRMLTMFTTQRNQNFNILADAALEYHYATINRRAGTITADEEIAATKKLARAASSQLVAAGTYVAIRYIADAILHNMNAYRDDDDELTAESVLGEIFHQFGSSISGMVILGSDLYDFVYKSLTHKTYYGLALSGVSTISDIADSLNKAFTNPNQKNIEKAAFNLSTAFGIPVSNAKKIINGMKNHILDIKNSEFLSFEAGVERTTGQQKNRWLDAALGGNTDKVKKVQTEMMDARMQNGDTEEEARKNTYANIKDEVRDAIKSGEIGEAEAVDVLYKNEILSREEASAKVDWWYFRYTEEGHDDWTEATYAKYIREAEPVGIAPEQYKAFREFANDAHDGDTTRKEQIQKYINGLKLTKKQKDALYLTVYKNADDAPWN